MKTKKLEKVFKIKENKGEIKNCNYRFLARNSQMPKDDFVNLYKTTEDCIGCGICTKVCPAGCYRIENGNAVLQVEGCQVCMACARSCYKMEIQLTMPEKMLMHVIEMSMSYCRRS